MVTMTHTGITREEIWHAFRRTPDVRLRERYHGMLLLMEGRSCPEMTQWWSRDEDPVQGWGHAFNREGLQGLARAPIPGRPTCLTPEQRTQVRAAVRRCPREAGDHVNRWTTQRVRHFRSTRVGITFCRERVRQRLHELGFRLRRWRHRHLKARAEEQEACIAELEALREAWPEEWELRLIDEATVRRHPTLTAQWCLVDEGPEGPTGDDHTKVQVDGPVAPLTGWTHDPISPELGQGEFAPFLEHLLASHPGTRLLVIHDRGAPQKGAPVEAVVQEAQGRLVLQVQPAYAPELPPQERIWKWWRRVVTHRHWFETLTEPIAAMRHVFRDLAGVNDQVRQLCGFNTPGSLVASL